MASPGAGTPWAALGTPFAPDTVEPTDADSGSDQASAASTPFSKLHARRKKGDRAPSTQRDSPWRALTRA